MRSYTNSRIRKTDFGTGFYSEAILAGLVDDTNRTSRGQSSDKGDCSLLAATSVFSKSRDYFLQAHEHIDKPFEVLYMWRGRRRQMD